MIIELRPLDASNIEACRKLKVSEKQADFIASNDKSIADAADNAKVARPFAIYADEVVVGFTMFAFESDYEDPDDRYWLWRFMIDERYQGRGYGRKALELIIAYFKEHGASNIRLSTKAANQKAIHLYESFGFEANGNMNGEETVFALEFP